LAALAQSAGAVYTRYADDLAFSGGGSLERSPVRFFRHVCRIAIEEGFAVRAAKTRIMRAGVRQQLAGVVVNVRPNIRRDEFDLLKAILTNCARHGPASQNRAGVLDFRGHLLGRIAYVTMLNPDAGASYANCSTESDGETPLAFRTRSARELGIWVPCPPLWLGMRRLMPTQSLSHQNSRLERIPE
jgi:hypothetical protein